MTAATIVGKWADHVPASTYRKRAARAVDLSIVTPEQLLVLFQSLGRGESIAAAAALMSVTPAEARAAFIAARNAMSPRGFIPLDALPILLDAIRAAMGETIQ